MWNWANSAIDADYRVVVDTGSNDDTVEEDCCKPA